MLSVYLVKDPPNQDDSTEEELCKAAEEITRVIPIAATDMSVCPHCLKEHSRLKVCPHCAGSQK